MAIRYTPGQLRDALQLTKETFRYWKKNLPALNAASGHSPCFGPGDLLATAIVKHATEVAGVSVSRLSSLAEQLFTLSRSSAWVHLERLTAVLSLEEGRVTFSGGEAGVVASGLTVLIPLRPIVAALRERLNEADVDPQGRLALPPVALVAGRRL